MDRYRHLWDRKHADRENIDDFGRRSKQREKYLQLWAKYSERQLICNFWRKSMRADKMRTVPYVSLRSTMCGKFRTYKDVQVEKGYMLKFSLK